MAASGKVTEKGEPAKGEEAPKGFVATAKSVVTYILDLLWVHWFLVGLGVAIGACPHLLFLLLQPREIRIS